MQERDERMSRIISGIAGFSIILSLFFFSGITMADTLPFNQNQGGFSGYQSGAYDSLADQPTADNWDRQSRFSAGQHPELKWVFSIASPISGTPVIGADGSIYFGAENGKFYALDRNGQEKWVFRTGGPILSSAALAENGIIYMTSKDGKIRALNADGILQWTYDTSDIIESSPVLGADGSVYVACKGGYLYALNPDGSLKWRYLTGGIDFPVSIDQDNSIYVSSREGSFFCLKPDGTPKWSCHLGSSPGTPAVDKDNNIYVYSADKLYAVNPKGQIRYSYNLNKAGEAKTYLAMSGGHIYVAANKLYSYSPSRAEAKEYAVYACSAPVIGADGTIYVGSRNMSGILSALDKNGEKLWDYSIGGIEGAPALGRDGIIYVGNREGKLYALDTYQLESTSFDPVPGDNYVEVEKTLGISFNKDIYPDLAYKRISLTDALVKPVSVQQSIEGKTLVIKPENNLLKDAKYFLKIPYNAVKDDLGRNLDEDLRLSFSTFSKTEKEPVAEFTIGENFYRVEGQLKGMDAQPFIKNSRSFVPVRYLALALGVDEEDIKWEDASQTVSLKKDKILVKVSTKSKMIDINGQSREMDVLPLNKNNRIYLPARYIAEAFGYKVDWDKEKEMINISW